MHGISEQTIINYADSRVNTSSINYSTGYNNGINYADGRVNTSSSSYTNGYNSGYSNGKNVLSTLTKGEKAFIGLLFTPIALENNVRSFIGGTKSNHWTPSGYEFVYNMSLDLSKITSVNCSSSGNSSGLTMHWLDANGNNITTIYNNGSTQVPSDAKGIIIETGSIVFVNVQFTSFATTDGKVHTASNLNY